MKIAIVGLGSIGRRHLKNLLALGEKDIILCRNRLSTLPDSDLSGFTVEHSIEATLKHKPDAVIIATPTAMHLSAAIPAAEAGCHILLEKPVSDSIDGIDDLKAALKRGGGSLLVGFQYRFHTTLQTASKIILDGEIGRIISVHSHWGEYLPDWHPWEDYRNSYAARKDLGGGVVLTLCHPFDYLNWLLGKPEVVWAYTGTMGNLGISVEDIAEIVLRFPDGAFGYVHLDYLQKPTEHSLEIIGTKGVLKWEAESGRLALFKHDSKTPDLFVPPSGFERNSMFLEEVRHFLSVARRETSPLCTLEDGLSAQEITAKVLAFKTSEGKNV